ncbi:cupin domain-containing protein [Chitinilyticum litopenaei]|uniref:cupin domain-containing protein n=1 Tax=Chitinilyticum litopenaei TaxID=1121276 RepID=UPI0004132D35|nr:cupin domain-containing protein [Chitinilyticum litopenaei]
MGLQLLGGLTPDEFLAEYWQKKPLLIRQAVTNFPGMVDLAGLSRLAQRDDVESRLIECRNGRWKLEHGPFNKARFNRLPESDWTLLVSNMNHLDPGLDSLLQQFSFLPYTRLDDLMVSWAPPGGSVGPHYDSYDVFLLQVGGQKQWQISSDDAGNFIEDAPIRVLRDFHAEQEWVLEHGDMLYLPPKYAHHGIALTAGMTWSIGFRAPKTQEIAGKFLEFLQDELCLEGMYSDPERRATSEPGRIDDAFVASITEMLKKVQWDDDTVRRFVGRYFSEPKPHVFFTAPARELDFAGFAAHVAQRGVELDSKSQLLFERDFFYLNGEELDVTPECRPLMQELAHRRRLPPATYADSLLELLHEQYLLGYLHPVS